MEQLTVYNKKDWRDVLAGALMIAFGLFCTIYASQHYKLGTPTRMGPGFFPMYLGYLLVIVGAFIMVPAFFRKGEAMAFEWRTTFWITLGVLLFAFTVKFIGLVPAIFLQVGASVLADDKLGIRGTLILAACTALSAHLIFYVALEIQLQAFIWPFQ